MFDFLKKKKNKNNNELHAIVNGTVINLSEVPDPVFAQKMMGDGFAMKPNDGDIYAPTNAKVKTVFPTKHALGLEMENGIEILLHFGIDTVELEGKPFKMFVNVGDTITPDTKIAHIDLEQLKAAGKDDSLIVVFTNGDKVKNFSVEEKATNAKDIIGTIESN